MGGKSWDLIFLPERSLVLFRGMREVLSEASFVCPECGERIAASGTFDAPRSAIVTRADAYERGMELVDEASTALQRHLKGRHGWDVE
jgi:hypothetical protein